MGLGSFDRAALIPLRSSFTSKVVVIASGITDRSLTVTGRGLSATICSFTSGQHEHVNETRPTRPANKHSNTDAMNQYDTSHAYVDNQRKHPISKSKNYPFKSETKTFCISDCAYEARLSLST